MIVIPWVPGPSIPIREDRMGDEVHATFDALVAMHERDLCRRRWLLTPERAHLAAVTLKLAAEPEPGEARPV